METGRRRGATTLRRNVWRLLAIGTIAWVGMSPPGASPRTPGPARGMIAAVDGPASDDACGGWRPKRPMLCAATVVATAIAGGLMSAIPNGGIVAFVAMAPLLLETCA